MNKNCAIAEDLMPLYTEGLLQEKTKSWLEEHVKSCGHCKVLAELSEAPLATKSIESPINHDKMMQKIKLKLSIYQIILVALSFYFAMETSMLNGSFGFILSYAVLGVVTYLFYKNVWLVTVIAFLPNFIWSLVDLAEFNMQGIIGSIFVGFIHLGFALIGSMIGWLILKLREGEKTS